MMLKQFNDIGVDPISVPKISPDQPSQRPRHPTDFDQQAAAGAPTPRVEQIWTLGLTPFLIVATAYLLSGLVGHDPWKADEAYVFGAVHDFFETGDWVVPAVAGEPFMEKPPLFYWVAAGFAWLFSPWLPLHDGARLATGFFMAVTCGAVGWTARLWWGRGYGRVAVLALLGCLGVVEHAHKMLPDIPLLTGFAISAAGFALIRAGAPIGGLLLGTGVGVGFLAKGLLAPGVIGVTALLLPVCFRDWRERAYFRAMAIAALAALPWLLIWPIALYLRSPSLFMDWFWLNNIGRFVGFRGAPVGDPHEPGFWLQTIPWFTFPALPLALVTLWRHRRTVLSAAPIQFSVLAFAVLMSVLGLSASARANYALPLLVPVCLLAAPAAIMLPARMDCLGDWIARVLFGALATFIWTVWILMMVRGAPPDWSLLTRYLPLDFAPGFNPTDFIVALGMTLLAIVIACWLPKIRGRGLASWVTGLALFWVLVSSLWRPWMDYAKSYRSVFASMQLKLPDHSRCMASFGLDENERAMLRYFVGINTQRREIAPSNGCDLLLIDGAAKSPPSYIDTRRWKLIWEGARPGDIRERFWLFEANGAPH